MKKNKKILIFVVGGIILVILLPLLFSYIFATPLSRIKSLTRLSNTIEHSLFRVNYSIYKLSGKSIPSVFTLKRPLQLSKSSILIGGGLLEKKIFIKNINLDRVTDMKIGNFDGVKGDELVIASNRQILFFDDHFKIKSTISLPPRTNQNGVEILS